MTIKELEQKTGMARANIRFYEDEGLLCPRRLGNGYRDYSDEDARTLEKIRLLRNLRLDIGTIRSVQRGALPLAQALAALLLCLAAQIFCALLARTPPRTGPLTVEAFSQNYGYFWQSLCAGEERPALPALDAGGRWMAGEQTGMSVTVSEETCNGVPVTGGITWSEPRFTLRDGKITAVTLHWESDRTVLFPGGTRETLALLALSGSGEGADPLRYDLRGWLELAEGFTRWESWEARRDGLVIVQQTEREGYRDEGAYLLAVPGETPRFARTVTISLSEE